tara:strand:+ start:577 stop:1017 length:441 start_codon:yes stop_codon:yes gene_type:complete
MPFLQRLNDRYAARLPIDNTSTLVTTRGLLPLRSVFCRCQRLALVEYHAGLNKGEARNALARAVFFNRLGEIRDRSFEQQRYRASGLNLVTAAIVLRNTVYLERASQALHKNGNFADNALLQHLSPSGMGTHKLDWRLRLASEPEG